VSIELPSATFAITPNKKLIIDAEYSCYNSILNLS